MFPLQTEDEDDASDEDSENEEADEVSGHALGEDEDVYCEYGVDFDEYHQIVQRLESSSRAHEIALATFVMRTRKLYHRLYRAGADLPQLRQQADNMLLRNEEEAVFKELEGRGTFDIRFMQRTRAIYSDVSIRELWNILQEMGYVWRPRMMRHDGHSRSVMASGWSLGNGRFFTTSDAEAYQGQIANQATLIPRNS